MILSYISHYLEPDQSRDIRWTSSFLLIATLHVLVFMGLLQRVSRDSVSMAVPAIEVAFVKLAPPPPIQPAPMEPIPEPEIETVAVPKAEPIITKRVDRKKPKKQRKVQERQIPEPEHVEQAKIEEEPVPVSSVAAAPKPAPVNIDLPASSGADTDYNALLSAWLNKYKKYPRRANKMGQTGSVEIEFTLNRAGMVLSHRIKQSSGYSILDHAVEESLRAAQPFPAIPSEMPDPKLCTVTLVFKLREDN